MHGEESIQTGLSFQAWNCFSNLTFKAIDVSLSLLSVRAEIVLPSSLFDVLESNCSIKRVLLFSLINEISIHLPILKSFDIDNLPSDTSALA